MAVSAYVERTEARPSISGINIVELATRRQVAQVSVEGVERVIEFSPDGTSLAIGTDKLASVHRVRDGVEVAKFLIGHRVMSIAFSHDGSLLAVGSDDDTVRVFRIESGALRAVVQSPELVVFGGGVSAVAFSPDGRFLASGVAADVAQLFNLETGEVFARLSHAGTVTALAFSPDGRLLATASADGMARVFTSRLWRETIRVPFGQRVESVAFSPDGSHVVAVSGPSVRVFDARTGIERTRVVSPEYIGSVTFSADSASLAVGAGHLAHVFESRPSNTIEPDPGTFALPTSPDGLTIAPSDYGGHTLTVLEVRTQKVVRRLDVGVGSSLSSVCFAAGGSLVVASSSDVQPSSWLTAFDTRSGQVRWKASSPERWESMTCASDGRMVAAKAGNEVVVTDARSGRTALRLNHRAAVNSFVLSGDGSLLATGSEDGYARVYVTATAQEIARMPLGEGVQRVAFEGDGVIRVTTGTFNKNEEQWFYRASREQFKPADRIASACARLTRNLTGDEWSEYVGGSYRETCPTLGVPVSGKAAPTPTQ